MMSSSVSNWIWWFCACVVASEFIVGYVGSSSQSQLWWFFFLVAVARVARVAVTAPRQVEMFDYRTEGPATDFPFLTNPQMHYKDRFYLKTVNGEYISVCFSCTPSDQNLDNQCKASLCVKDVAVRSSIFEYLPHRDGTFSVRSEANGKYWKRCDNCVDLCPNIICADGENPDLQPAKFVLIKNGDGTVSIKTDMGRMLELQDCAQSCGRIVASQGLGINRQFVIEKLPPPYSPPERLNRAPTKKFIAPSYAPISIPFQT